VETTSRQRCGAVLVSTVLMGAMVATHQLTPFALTAAAVALVLTNRSRAIGLPLLFGVMAVAWVSLVTEPFLAGRIHELLAGVGDVARSANASVGERLQGSDEHLLVLRIRLAMTAGLWVLGAIGGVLLLVRRGRRDLALPALAAAPFPLLAFQPYGGEMLLRVYLFALPFMAALSAVALLRERRASRLQAGLAVVVSLTMVAGFFFSRYGNERINVFSELEIETLDALAHDAPEGAVLVAATTNVPWRVNRYAAHDYQVLTTIEDDRGHALPRMEDLLSVVEGRRAGCAYVVFTASQRAYAELLGVWPRGAIDRLETQLRRSRLFEVVVENRDVVAFRPSERLVAGDDDGALPPSCGGRQA
jgi:hypothetical protein